MKDKKGKTAYNAFNLWKRGESERFTKRLAWFCACNSGRFSDDLCGLISKNDIQGLCTYDIDYSYYDYPQDLAYARQCLAFFSKNTDVVISGVDRRKAFEESFISTERKCSLTNKRFSFMFQSGHLMFSENGLVFAVSRKITEILGDCPQLCELDFRFGPGLNVGIADAHKTSPRHKLDAPLTYSADIVDEFMEKLVCELPWMFGMNSLHLSVGKLSAVPKNWKTFRSIIIEPILNGLIQLGIGKELKERLLHATGIDLSDQTRNQRLARKGSIDNSVATIDLRNASNTVALMVVYHLIQSEEWFNLLDCSRTSQIKYGKVIGNLEMFSSMGNGFTFELESIIFYAIAYVTVLNNGGDTSLVSVFGDDLIVPFDERIIDELYHNLSFFGFEVNSEKSYTTGCFRESCGVDYYKGINIRPFYLKDRWTDARLMGLLNFDLQNWNLFKDIRLDLESFLIARSPTINFGPACYGDGHIHFPTWEHQGKMHFRHSPTKRVKGASSNLKGNVPPFSFKTITKIPMTWNDELELGDRLYPLYSIYRKPPFKNQYVIVKSESQKSRIFTTVPTSVGSHEDPYILRGGWKTNVTTVRLFGW